MVAALPRNIAQYFSNQSSPLEKASAGLLVTLIALKIFSVAFASLAGAAACILVPLGVYRFTSTSMTDEEKALSQAMESCVPKELITAGFTLGPLRVDYENRMALRGLTGPSGLLQMDLGISSSVDGNFVKFVEMQQSPDSTIGKNRIYLIKLCRQWREADSRKLKILSTERLREMFSFRQKFAK